MVAWYCARADYERKAPSPSLKNDFIISAIVCLLVAFIEGFLKSLFADLALFCSCFCAARCLSFFSRSSLACRFASSRYCFAIIRASRRSVISRSLVVFFNTWSSFFCLIRIVLFFLAWSRLACKRLASWIFLGLKIRVLLFWFCFSLLKRPLPRGLARC